MACIGAWSSDFLVKYYALMIECYKCYALMQAPDALICCA